MTKTVTVSLRVPQSWEGRVDSLSVRQWMREYFERRFPLPGDPGPGGGFLRLSVPKQAMKVFAALADDSTSAALRRLIASKLALPAPRLVRAVPPAPTAPPAYASRSSSASSVRLPSLVSAVPEARAVSAVPVLEVSQGRDEVGYWADAVRGGMNFCYVPEALRPAVARLCPDALCGTLPAGVVYGVPGYSAAGVVPYQVGRRNWVAVESGVRSDWVWLVGLVVLGVLAWMVRSWIRRERKVSLELPAMIRVSVPEKFAEWIPR